MMDLGFEFDYDKIRCLINKKVDNEFFISNNNNFMIKNFIKILENEYKNFNLYDIMNFSLNLNNFTLSCVGKSLEKKENINLLIENLNSIRSDIKFNLKKIIGKNKKVLLLNISKSLFNNEELNKNKKRNFMKNLINNLFNLENLENVLVISTKNELNMNYNTIFSKIRNKNTLYELGIQKEIIKSKENLNIFLTSKIYHRINNLKYFDLIKVSIIIYYPHSFYSKSYNRFDYISYNIEIIDNIRNEHLHILVNDIELKIRNLIDEDKRSYNITQNYLSFLNKYLNIYNILIMFLMLDTITLKEKIIKRFKDIETIFLI